MRIQRWEKILAEYIENEAQIPFEWGVSDCLMFAGNAAYAITGHDPIAEARGQYHDLRTAAELSANLGIKTEEIFDRFYERGEIPYARRGDIVLKNHNNGATFGIVYNGKAVFRLEGLGLVYEPLRSVGMTWRVD